MSSRAAITVDRSREEVQRLWSSAGHPALADATVTFKDAPGDRGTEIHVELGDGRSLPSLVQASPLAKAKDELRRFKQRVETGEVPRSDAVPEGELAERKLKRRPAQPLQPSELEKAGA